MKKDLNQSNHKQHFGKLQIPKFKRHCLKTIKTCDKHINILVIKFDYPFFHKAFYYTKSVKIKMVRLNQMCFINCMCH